MDGVPPWMERPFSAWLEKQLVYQRGNGGRILRTPRVQGFDTLTRRTEPLTQVLEGYGVAGIRHSLSEGELMHFVDYLVHVNAKESTGPSQNDQLETLLKDAGSAWRVGIREGNAGLERRMPEGVQLAAEHSISNSGTAGKFLAEAWQDAFGRSPNPESAFVKAIKAVEAAAVPVVCSNDKTAHFGKVIGQMRRDGNWSLPFDREHAENPTSGVLLDMCQALWSGHSDRHPGEDYVPTTQTAGEAAVLMAVPLVQWFSSGAVAQRATPK